METELKQLYYEHPDISPWILRRPSLAEMLANCAVPKPGHGLSHPVSESEDHQVKVVFRDVLWLCLLKHGCTTSPEWCVLTASCSSSEGPQTLSTLGFLCAMVNSMTKSSFWRKGFILVTFPCHSSSSTAVRASNSSQELKQRPRDNAAR